MNNTTKPAAPAPCQTRRMIPKIGPETIKRASDHLVRMGSSRSPWYRARTGTSITVRLVRRSTTSRTFSGISTVTVGTSAPMRRPAEQWMARPPGLTRTRQRMLLTYRLLCAVRWVNCTMLSMDIRTEQFGSDADQNHAGSGSPGQHPGLESPNNQSGGDQSGGDSRVPPPRAPGIISHAGQ